MVSHSKKVRKATAALKKPAVPSAGSKKSADPNKKSAGPKKSAGLKKTVMIDKIKTLLGMDEKSAQQLRNYLVDHPIGDGDPVMISHVKDGLARVHGPNPGNDAAQVVSRRDANWNLVVNSMTHNGGEDGTATNAGYVIKWNSLNDMILARNAMRRPSDPHNVMWAFYMGQETADALNAQLQEQTIETIMIAFYSEAQAKLQTAEMQFFEY